MKITSRVVFVISALFVVAVLATTARSAPGQRGQRGMGPGRGPGSLPILHRLSLTDTQKEQVRTILAERSEQRTGETLGKLHQDLMAAVMADTPDTAKIEQLKTSINEAQTAALNERVDLQLRIAQILMPEQRQKARDLPAGPAGAHSDR
jgi:Spy/CpxP family protein refolding chaperone